MGALMRSEDWSSTPVGAVELWPESLKISVAVCLRSKFPIVIWWGREHLTQFYNDAYISFLGKGKHPGALGQSARECWKELWHIIDPMLEGVFQTGEATWSEDLLFVIDRALPREEGYFTFSYSGIPQSHEAIGGIFCACVETTDRVIGERQLALLRELAARTADAHTWRQACRLSAEVLDTNRYDLPFTLIYIVDGEAQTISLAAKSGMSGEFTAVPQSVALGKEGLWPFTRVLQSKAPFVISKLHDLLPAVPNGPWPEPPTQAVALPILPSGQTGMSGVLIVGLNRYRPFDAKYQRFLSLVATQISANIADAYSYEQESKRVEALAEIDRAKTAFFSNVSHEFRTPLTLMVGPVESILERAHPTAIVTREELQLVHRNSMRLLKIVNTLLDFSRIEAGRAEAIYEPTDLSTFTADTASAFRSAMEQAGLKFVIDCQPLSEPAHVDRDMWEKIVLNLISNAFKYTLAGGVTVRLQPATNDIELRVEDTGLGIPENQRSKIFERFHRVEGVKGRSHEGSGIGLALVRELAKLHHGSIRVESAVGKGSSFIVSIPKRRTQSPTDGLGTRERILKSTGVAASAYVEEALQWLPETPQMTESQPVFASDSVKAPHVQTTSGTILLADDNADMRQYVRRLLGDNYNIRAVPTVRKHWLRSAMILRTWCLLM